MESVVRLVDALNAWVGKVIAWLTLAMVLLTAYLVVMRYLFNENSIAMQEAVMYMFAAVFMLGAAYTLQLDEHVRVDVLYRNFSPRAKAWANIFGTLFFLLPFAGLVLWFSWDYAADAWRYKEGSPQAGGLPYVYVLKMVIPITAIMLLLQGIAEILRNILSLKGIVVMPQER